MGESIYQLFENTVNKHKNKPAIKYFCPIKQKWTIKHWLELEDEVSIIAKNLSKLGLEAKNCIAFISPTRPEWVISDIACMKIGAIVVPIYHSSVQDQVSYIINDAKVSMVLVENEEQLIKIRNVQNTISLSKVIIIDKIEGALKSNEIYFSDLLKPINYDATFAEIQKSDIASIVYTSGTTGEPKGAMMSHDNFLYEAEVIDKVGIISSKDTQLLLLPLAHIFARILEMAWLRTGHLLGFSQSIEQAVDNMEIIKPTFMAGVPRIFEKIKSKVMETALNQNIIKKNIAQFAFSNASKFINENSLGSSIGLFFSKKLVFDKIGNKLKERFGGRLRFFISGGAALSPEVANFFKLSDIIICEGYGLTETTAAACLNLPWAIKIGTVGRALPGTEIKLSDDGEICVRGRNIFLGFWQKPEETQKVLSADGWFKTGDLGIIDDDGFIKIIDRKKDLIITSQGKNIAPQRVENLIKFNSHLIAQVVVVGDAKPYLVALISLDLLQTTNFLSAHNKILNTKDFNKDSLIKQEIKAAIDKANESLASFEQIKKFQILSEEFQIGQELTPTLKVKRKFCTEKFKKEINKLYT